MRDIPKHVAIIMDGNRRWAKKKGLPCVMGHRQGIKSMEKIVKTAMDAGVEILTLYTFSTENWNRPKKEVGALISLLEHYLNNEYKKLLDNDIRLMTIGSLDRFTPALRRMIEKMKELSKKNSGIILNLALNYGARGEIVVASRRIAEDVKKGDIRASDISEKLFSRYLYTGTLPDPDLVIRTGGEFRMSNFLLWQICYSEIYVTNTFWPDFRKKDFMEAVRVYAKRERRLGA